MRNTVIAGEDGHKELLWGAIWCRDGVAGYEAARGTDSEVQELWAKPL